MAGAPGSPLGPPADEPARLEPGSPQDPRAHRGRRRLAMRPGDDQRPSPREKTSTNRLGHGRALQAEALALLRLRIGLPNGVAHDDAIGPRLEVPGLIALQATDTELF